MSKKVRGYTCNYLFITYLIWKHGSYTSLQNIEILR